MNEFGKRSTFLQVELLNIGTLGPFFLEFSMLISLWKILSESITWLYGHIKRKFCHSGSFTPTPYSLFFIPL